MTESTATAFAPARLERPRDSAFQGVCTALARATGTEPVLWRVLTVILTLFGGLGFVLYVLGIVMIPREDEEFSLVHRAVHGPERHFSTNQVLLLGLAAAVFIGYVGDFSHTLVIVVALVLGFLWWRSRVPLVPTAPPLADPATTQPAASPTRPVSPPLVSWTPPPPAPPRPKSPFGAVTLSVATLVAGLLALLSATGTDMPVAVPIAAALAVVGVGLVAGSFFGRSWGLFWLAALLTVALGAATATQPLLDDGVGKRDWSPTGSASYRLGAGKAVIDLVTVSKGADITAHVGYGELLVLVPTGTDVAIDASNDYGDIDLFDTSYGGRHQSRTFDDGDATVRLHLSARAGEVKVVRS
ncbi:MAG: PspC domain protein [Frankiales bacterium]|nr:PspC domain protein [Frankiales bacterium]